MDNIIYANGFRVSIGGLETQLMFKLESPVVDENDNISGISLKDVADIRINIALAKQLSEILKNAIDDYENQNNEVNNSESVNE